MDRRSLARLCAVQAIYQISMTGQSPAQVAAQFESRAFEMDGLDLPDAPDGPMFQGLVHDWADNRPDIETRIAEGLAEGKRQADRIEALLLAILRCGVVELAYRPDIPASVTVNEYIDIAHAFYDGGEPGLVNAVLDSIAKSLQNGASGAAES